MAIMKQGYGYWCLDRFPYGGDFHRAVQDVQVKVLGWYKPKSDIHIDFGGSKIAICRAGLDLRDDEKTVLGIEIKE